MGARAARTRPSARDYTGAAMDVAALVERLDDLVHEAKAVPLTDQVRVEREELLELIEEVRAALPEEVKQARWIVMERGEMLAEAERERDRALAHARENGSEAA